MPIRFIAATAAVFHLAIAGADASEKHPLSLAEAVLLAEQAEDPAIGSWTARADALEHRGEADQALPDPMLRVGMANLPLSDLDPNREAMTQIQLGVRQRIPRGETRDLQRARRYAQAGAARANGEVEARAITRAVRLAWLETYYWERASDLTRTRREEIRQLSEVAVALFASGGGNSHDVIRVELETALLDARLIELDRNIGTSRAQLARYVGLENAGRDVIGQLPVLPVLPTPGRAVEALSQHPAVRAGNARVEASQRGIDIALEAYRPQWSIDAGYGLRDSRSDVASVGVSMEMPLFSRRRQDEGVAGARDARSAEEMNRQVLLLDLRRQLDALHVQHSRYSETVAVYESTVQSRALETVEAVMAAYENEQADFAEVVRSELALLDIELTLIRTRVDALKAQSQILYLTGDVQ